MKFDYFDLKIGRMTGNSVLEHNTIRDTHRMERKEKTFGLQSLPFQGAFMFSFVIRFFVYMVLFFNSYPL